MSIGMPLFVALLLFMEGQPRVPVPPGSPARPKVEMESIFDPIGDFPASAHRRYEEGTVDVELTVATDGRVTNCNIMKSSGSDSLDHASCRIMKSRVRFLPALGAEGRPTASTYLHRFHWKLPPPPLASRYALIYDWFGDPLIWLNRLHPPHQVAPVLLRGRFNGAAYRGAARRAAKESETYYRVTISPSGRVSRCVVVGSSGSAELDGLICPHVLRRTRYSPARDEDGTPVQIHWIERMKWDLGSSPSR